MSTIDSSAPAIPEKRRLWRVILSWLWMHLVPRRLRAFLSARFAETEPPEVWGYVVWGLVGIVIATPELAAATGGNGFPWRTISTTTGHLEDLWPTFAIVPVGLITILAYGALRFAYNPGDDRDVQLYYKHGPVGAEGLPERYTGVARSEYGRPIRGDVDLSTGQIEGRRRVIPIRWYFPVAVVVIALSSFGAAEGNSPWYLEYVMYGLIFVFGIVIPNVLSYVHTDLPFYNAVFTLRALDKRLHLFGYLIAAGLGILFVHLALYSWPDFGRTPANWAGISPGHAQEVAEGKIAEIRHDLQPLKVLTGERIVTSKHEQAWIFYFTTSEKKPSVCTVLVQGHTATPTSCGVSP